MVQARAGKDTAVRTEKLRGLAMRIGDELGGIGNGRGCQVGPGNLRKLQGGVG